jgi:hypothetical protein
MDDQILSVDSVNAIVASVTHQGNVPLSELEAERLLNAIARARLGVPTGSKGQSSAQNTQVKS